MSGHNEHAPSMRSTYVMFIATFLFGVLTGAVIFFQGNTGKEGDGAIPKNTSSFTVYGYMYGGCEPGKHCTSYKVEQNGSYLFIVRDTQKGTKYEGKLADAEKGTLQTLAKDTPYAEIATRVFTGTCPITFDGMAYRYEVEYKGERYVFDSCKTNIEGVPLFDTLQTYFDLFGAAHPST